MVTYTYLGMVVRSIVAQHERMWNERRKEDAMDERTNATIGQISTVYDSIYL